MLRVSERCKDSGRPRAGAINTLIASYVYRGTKETITVISGSRTATNWEKKQTNSLLNTFGDGWLRFNSSGMNGAIAKE